MSTARTFGWFVLVAATLAVAIVPEFVGPNEPKDAIILDHAIFVTGNNAAKEVALPQAIYPKLSGQPDSAQYLAAFDLRDVPAAGLFLFIPTLNRNASVKLNGEKLFSNASTALWTGPISNTSDLVHLPGRILAPGKNQLTVTLQTGRFMSPVYISKIYIGRESELAPLYRWRLFVDEHLKSMGFGAHILTGIGLVLVYFMRRHDPMYSWLAALNIVTFFTAAGNFLGFQPGAQMFLPYAIASVPAAGLLLVGVALTVVGIRPPKALTGFIIAITCACMFFAFLGTPLMRGLSALCAVVFWMLGSVVATAIYARASLQKNNTDARLMLPPAVVWSWFVLRDAYISATLPEHAFNLLTPFGRPFFLAMLAAVLMRRMGDSLGRVDRANENLNARLAEQEAELAAFHRHERVKAGNLIRDQERQRLTHDLHDGISGHLASIIALSERAGERPIELAAREALNDLRLVIYSLDLGDSELPLALANFRERLIPQLQRLGVTLEWSIMDLPEVSGVTPGNALAILRILQEAITNAVKHGPARRIGIRGALSADGMVAIALENDGRPFVEGPGGHGLSNMRRRAQHLRGQLSIENTESGVRLTLLLPPRLPDFEDEAAAEFH